MKPTVRRLGVTFVCLALAVATGTAYGSSEPTASGQGIVWKRCAEDPTAQCGTLRVPVNWAAPQGKTFELALARRKATDPSRRIGSLLVNPGGPGGSGVDFAMNANYFSPEVLARFDIVGFDPRGVARSNPVRCSAALLGRAPTASPRNQAEFTKLQTYNRQLGADCRRHTGPLIDHVDTVSVVRDIDAIRKAVGDRKLNYYGVSYGTLMGEQYAELFGANIRAMVIDSNMDHSVGVGGFMRTEAETAEDSFAQFAAWCRRDARCALHGRDVGKVWDSLLARADRGKLFDPNDPQRTPIPARDVIGAAFSSFYGPDWAGLASYLEALDTGRPGVAAAARAPRFAGEDLGQNPFPAVFCQDWNVNVGDHKTFARHTARARAGARHMRMSPLAEFAVTSCQGWPTKFANPQHPLKVRNVVPLLMLNALHDPATGYAWAVNARRQMGAKAVLVTYDGWGHGVYDRSACTRRVVDQYLLGLAVPRNGTHCAAVSPAPSSAARRGLPVPVGPRPTVPGWNG